MKESRFVELLNLYVDHELTQSEAAELEAELQRNPSRRTALRQYRALQRGCELLLEADRALAPRTAEAVRSLRDRRSEGSRPARFRSSGWSWFAGAGAAAGLAVLIALGVSRPFAPATASSATGSALGDDSASRTLARGADAAAMEMWEVKVPAAEPRGLRMRSLWIPASAERTSGASFVASGVPDLSWLDDVRIPAVRAPRPEELRFSERANPSRAVDQIPPSQRPLQATLEMTAFQFQR